MSANNSPSSEIQSSPCCLVGLADSLPCDSPVFRLTTCSKVTSQSQTASPPNKDVAADLNPDSTLPELTTEHIGAIKAVARNYGLDDAISNSIGTGSIPLGQPAVTILFPAHLPKKTAAQAALSKTVGTQVSFADSPISDVAKPPAQQKPTMKSIGAQVSIIKCNLDSGYSSGWADVSSASDVMSHQATKGLKISGFPLDRGEKQQAMFRKSDSASRGPISFASSPSGTVLSWNAGSAFAISEIGGQPTYQGLKTQKLLNRCLLNATELAQKQMISPTHIGQSPRLWAMDSKSEHSQRQSIGTATTTKARKFALRQMTSPRGAGFRGKKSFSSLTVGKSSDTLITHTSSSKESKPTGAKGSVRFSEVGLFKELQSSAGAVHRNSLQAVRGSPKQPTHNSSSQPTTMEDGASFNMDSKYGLSSIGTVNSENARNELCDSGMDRPSNIAVRSSRVKNPAETPSPSVVQEDEVCRPSMQSNALSHIFAGRPKTVLRPFAAHEDNVTRNSRIAVWGTPTHTSNRLSSPPLVGSVAQSPKSGTTIRPSTTAVRGSAVQRTTCSVVSNPIADVPISNSGCGSATLTSETSTVQGSNAAVLSSPRSQHLMMLSPAMNFPVGQSASIRSNVSFSMGNTKPSILAVRGTPVTTMGDSSPRFSPTFSNTVDQRTSTAAVRGTGYYSAAGNLGNYDSSVGSGLSEVLSTTGFHGSPQRVPHARMSSASAKTGPTDKHSKATSRPRSISFAADCVPSIHIFRHDESADVQQSTMAVDDGTSHPHAMSSMHTARSTVSTRPAIDTQPATTKSKHSISSAERTNLPLCDGEDVAQRYSNVNVAGSIFSDAISAVPHGSRSTRSTARKTSTAADRILSPESKIDMVTHSPPNMPLRSFLRTHVTHARSPTLSPRLPTCDLTLQTPHLHVNDAPTEDGSLFDRLNETANFPISPISVPLTAVAGGWVGFPSRTSSDGQGTELATVYGQTDPSMDGRSVATSAATWLRSTKK